MNLVLTISLFVLLLVSVMITKYDLIHPAVIFSALWFFSSFLWLLMVEQWRAHCSIETFMLVMVCNILCVITMIVFSRVRLVIGSRGGYSQVNTDYSLGCSKSSSVWKRRIIVVALIVFYVICTRMMFTRIGELASLASRYEDSNNAIYLARISEINGVGFGRFYVNIMRINVAIGIVVAKKVTDMISNHEKGYKIYIFFLLYVVFFSVIRGSRTDMMYVLGAYLFIFIYSVYKNDHDRKKSTKKAFKYLMYFMIAIVVVWVVSGIFFSRVGTSVIRNVIGYVGGPFAGLDYFLTHPESIGSNYFGQNTFDSIYAMLSRFDILPFERARIYLPYAGNNNFRINVYTMYGRYFSDFGYAGCLILSFLFSAFYGIMYNKLRNSVGEKKENAYILIYASCMYPLLMSFFEDRFFSYINNTFFLVIFVLLINRFIFFEKH